MRLIHHRKSLSVNNMDLNGKTKKRPSQSRHSDLLPDSIRCIISGPSNCGKTNVILCLLLELNGLKFENIYLYSKTPFQQKYIFLGKILEKLKNIGYFVFSENANIVKPCEAKRNSIFIFDDVACDKQNIMRDYFSMGRHSFVDCFYLCQTYSRIPKQLIRDNANFLIIFKQDETNLRHIYDDHVNTDMTFDYFKKMCATCWNEKYGFLVIDKDSEIEDGRYRKGFDVYIKR